MNKLNVFSLHLLNYANSMNIFYQIRTSWLLFSYFQKVHEDEPPTNAIYIDVSI